jgi:hypothetical protein
LKTSNLTKKKASFYHNPPLYQVLFHFFFQLSVSFQVADILSVILKGDAFRMLSAGKNGEGIAEMLTTPDFLAERRLKGRSFSHRHLYTGVYGQTES